MIRHKQWWLAGLLLTSGVTHAGCELISGNGTATPFYMDIGRVMVQPQTPPGTVIASRSWPLRDSHTQLQCNGSQTFDAQVIAAGSRQSGNQIWSTNIPGIGLRFTLQNQAQQIVYPGKLSIGGKGNTTVSLQNLQFKLDVIKTADLVGSGAISAGQYTTFGSGSHAFLNTWMRENSLIIVAPSCRVMSNNNFRINLGTIPLTALKGYGTGAGGRNFTIRMQCAGSVSLSGTHVNMTFNGNVPEGMSPAQGVIRNESRSNSAAVGIGVQLMDESRRPVPFRQANHVATLNSSPMQFLDLRYFARFYQYQAKASAGNVTGHMVFRVSYN